ncbi:Na+/H+ antiporter NhaA [Caulobacter sp. 73W]|uniref:Na(+)/H(+) antiporter NhaA n=1 Tax=Caulobacter sp. 73W TaxID=3161137 RepID=A0AB39KPV3_9CAUL
MARKITLDFLKTAAASGAALGIAALAALIIANSPWASGYFHWLKGAHALQVGPLRLELTISEWIKEGLMAVFFLMVGMEIKYEILKGELSDPRRLATPVLAAFGGMAGPALVYLLISRFTGAAFEGWPIPLATDIAFALAVFAFVGKGLPTSLRVFLLTLAIVDDLGAIALIALLFSSGAHLPPLVGVVGLLVFLGLVAHRVRITAPFWALGFAAVWYLTVLSGLSTSLTAVAFAVIVPLQPRKEDGQSPIKEAIHDLHPWNAFLVLPLFAFAKAGVSFAGMSISALASPLVVAIALGLFVGKQAGVLGMAALASRLGVGARPSGASWMQVYGVAVLCGVGFTMSLFIGALAFPGAVDSPQQVEVKLGVLGGSLLSVIWASIVLSRANRQHAQA